MMMRVTKDSVERMMTAKEIADRIRKPVKFVNGEFACGRLKGTKFGGNRWLALPSEVVRYQNDRANGFLHALPSSSWERDERGITVRGEDGRAVRKIKEVASA